MRLASRPYRKFAALYEGKPTRSANCPLVIGVLRRVVMLLQESQFFGLAKRTVCAELVAHGQQCRSILFNRRDRLGSLNSSILRTVVQRRFRLKPPLGNAFVHPILVALCSRQRRIFGECHRPHTAPLDLDRMP